MRGKNFKKNECPFGYGVRANGKVLFGARVEEWLNKSIQGDNYGIIFFSYLL